MTKSKSQFNFDNNHLIQSEILAFIIDRQARHVSKNTLLFYQGELERSLSFFKTHRIYSMEQITPDSIRQYLIQLSEHRNPGGIHAAYRTMRVFIKWYAMEMDDLSYERLIRKVHPPKVNTGAIPGIPLDHIKALLATCDNSFSGVRDRAIFFTLLDTGVRRAEFIGLDIRDVDFKHASIMIRSGKGNKDRVVFLSATTRRELVRYLRRHPRPGAQSPLWVKTTGDRLSMTGLREMLRRRSTRAKIPLPQLHGFRRAFAVESLRNSIDLVSLSRLMGHADLQTTQRYLHLLTDDLKAAHERSSPADNL